MALSFNNSATKDRKMRLSLFSKMQMLAPIYLVSLNLLYDLTSYLPEQGGRSPSGLDEDMWDHSAFEALQVTSYVDDRVVLFSSKNWSLGHV